MVKTIWFHHVKDFTSWKKVFDSFYDVRKQNSEKSYSVGTVIGDPTNVYVINEWTSLEAFNTFRNLTELKDTMMKAGVIEEPKITLVDEVMQEAHHNY